MPGLNSILQPVWTMNRPNAPADYSRYHAGKI